MKVALHLTDSGLSGWSVILKWWCRLFHRVPLRHVAVQVGDVVLDVCPINGVRYVPARSWLRVMKPYQSIALGSVDQFDWRECNLPELTANAWVIALGDALGFKHTSCVSVSRQLLISLGYDVDECRTPQDLMDWGINQ